MHSMSFATTVIIRTIARAARDKRGSTAIEYGLILAFIVIVMIAGLTALAHATTGLWSSVDSVVTTAR